MPNELVQYTVSDIEKIGATMAKSKLFGVQTPEQAVALCLLAQAEGRHPALAARDYNIIQNKPAKTSDAMLRDFLASQGKVEWHSLTNEKADATFSHPSGGSVRIDWDMARAASAGLGGKDMWKKYPRQMLRARVISEGVRTVCPEATSGMYVPEEVRDFDAPPMKDVTPKQQEAIEIDESLESLKQSARDAAGQGGDALDAFMRNAEPYKDETLSTPAMVKKRNAQLISIGEDLRKIATESDNKALEGTEAP